MPTFVRLAAQADMPPEGEAREFPCGERVLCVANVHGAIHAIDNVCLHRGGPLGQGTVEGNKIVCPWHGWQFDTSTGEATHNPTAKVAVFPIKIEGGDVMVEI